MEPETKPIRILHDSTVQQQWTISLADSSTDDCPHPMAATGTESIVVLGVAGDIVDDDSSVHNIAAKAGGRPCFSGSEPPCKATHFRCGICKQLMMLAVQVPH